MKKPGRLEGKIAVITGGGDGIGRATALLFAREGAHVAIYDVNLEAAAKTAAEIEALGQKALAIKCDVSRSDEVNRATDQVIDKFKRIDILVNNAGMGGPMPALDVTEAFWDRIFNINLKGQFWCCQAVGRQMIKQKYGKIVNIASAAGHVNSFGNTVYSASKAAVVSMTRGLAVEWGIHNINVNAVSPGITETALLASVKSKSSWIGKAEKRLPLRRLNKPEDVASAILFLASDESDKMTGQAILVDGGATALNSSYTWPEEK